MEIKDLATQSGADRVRLALGLDRDQVAKIQTLVQSMIKSNPHISKTFVGKSKPNVSFYDFTHDRLGIGHSSPHVLAHEMGHAASLGNSSEFYKNLLRASKKATRLSNSLALPISSFIGLNPKMTGSQKDTAYDVAAIASGLLAAPNLLEELKASATAVTHSPTKLRTGVAMVPGFVSHSVNDLAAPATYYLGKKLVRSNSDD